MRKEKDGELEEGAQVLMTTVHCWQNELSWSLNGMKYCQLLQEANLEKRLPVTQSINHHSVGQLVSRSVSQPVSQSVSRSMPVN